MGLLDRIKSSYIYTNWKVGRYTRRRRYHVPVFDQRDTNFYTRNYRNGEYLHQDAQRRRMSQDVYLSSKGTFGSSSYSIIEVTKDTFFEYGTVEYSGSGKTTRWDGGSNYNVPQYGMAQVSKNHRRRTLCAGEFRCSETYNMSW